ncbi:MAG: macro domain-containing protein, partial [Candidatus Nitrosocosmicus sp.]|nr:macro domain-containing protein [Candidatus Nitrosocosmicus sp.]
SQMRPGHRTADYRLNNTIFRVMYADITLLTSDALVSSDDNKLSMSGGVSLAIKNAGGESIKQDTKKHLPMNIGDVAVTSAGNLAAKYIFHAVTIDRTYNINPSKENIGFATMRCMQLADALGIRRIAFPALGTGTGGFPYQLAAESMTRTIADYIMDETKIELVVLCLFSRSPEVSKEDIFYEHAAAQASLYTQSKKLTYMMKNWKDIADRTNNPTISKLAEDLSVKLNDAHETLTETPNIESVRQINKESELNEITGMIIDISTKIQDTTAAQSEDSSLDVKILKTKLTGLQTQLNYYISELNRSEIQLAKFGKVNEPSILLNTIDDLRKVISEKEIQVTDTKSQLEKLWVKY